MKKILSLLVAFGMIASLTACAGQSSSTASDSTTSEAASEATATEETASEEAAPATAGTVLTHDEYMAADVDTEVTIQTYVQAKQSWWEDKATVYAQSEDGAYFLYDMACSEEDYDKLTPGTCIQVTGYKSEWSGEVEITDGTFTIVEDAEPFIAEPLDVTDLLGSDELIDHQNELVSFKGLTVEPSTMEGSDEEHAFLYNWDGSGTDGDDLYFNASCNGQTYTFTIESYLCDNTTDVYAAVKNLEVGQTIDMEGFLYWYEGVETSAGTIKAELYPEIAPNTVRNFINLVQAGFYDGTIFHRVIPGFMIQGGDPEGSGMGGPGYSIRGEFSQNGFRNDLKHTRGVLSMARTMMPDSAGSQFFIMVADAPHLDGQYAAFGKVIEGMEAADAIVSSQRDRMDKPLKDQVMKKVTVETFGETYPEPEKC